ncbi:hypothetical protein ACFLZW_00560 [Chloroflexota bacterium]
MSQDICILVASCDKYADLWPPFFSLFWKYWPDCPYPVYLGSNIQHYPNEQIKSILIGKDSGWSAGLSKMLAVITAEKQYQYVLLLLDDFFFKRTVNTQLIEECAQTLQALNGNYLRLHPAPPPDTPVDGFDRIGEIAPGAPYRVSLQASIWRLSFLLNFLNPGEDPWNVEVVGSRRTDHLQGFYSVWKPALRYLNSVERGKWYPHTLQFLKNEGIRIENSNRAILQNEDFIKRRIRTTFLLLWRRLHIRNRMKIAAKIREIGLALKNRLFIR